MWSCVEIPDAAESFGTGKAVRVNGSVEGIKFANVGLMVTGKGGHMLPLLCQTARRS